MKYGGCPWIKITISIAGGSSVSIKAEWIKAESCMDLLQLLHEERKSVVCFNIWYDGLVQISANSSALAIYPSYKSHNAFENIP